MSRLFRLLYPLKKPLSVQNWQGLFACSQTVFRAVVKQVVL
ncbi:hypothetical protein ApDm4_1775 [Acetobacter pomorum]|nr:hypothetical protein ApDm4_1775 [Acetobacter pomorum]